MPSLRIDGAQPSVERPGAFVTSSVSRHCGSEQGGEGEPYPPALDALAGLARELAAPVDRNDA